MVQTKRVLIVPFGFDLERNRAGEVILGPGTKLACDEAVRIGRDLWSEGHEVHILTTATRAPKYDQAMLGELMQNYLWAKLYEYPERNFNVTVTFSEASSFNTLGEVLATADYLEQNDFDEVRFAVKKWHLRRVKMLVLKVFARRRIRAYPHFDVHRHWPGLRDRFFREPLALILNWWRLRKMYP